MPYQIHLAPSGMLIIPWLEGVFLAATGTEISIPGPDHGRGSLRCLKSPHPSAADVDGHTVWSWSSLTFMADDLGTSTGMAWGACRRQMPCVGGAPGGGAQ